jgi:hypothetical protein
MLLYFYGHNTLAIQERIFGPRISTAIPVKPENSQRVADVNSVDRDRIQNATPKHSNAAAIRRIA